MHVNRRVHFQQIADVLQIPVEELKVLNPQYRQECIPGDLRPYPLVLPTNLTYSYIMSEDAICGNNADQYARRLTVEPSTGDSAQAAPDGQEGEWVTSEKTLYHKVKRGETMSSIAKKYGVSLWSLKNANGNIRTARRGQTLKVVTTERTFKPKAPESASPAEGDDLLVKQEAPQAATEDTTAPAPVASSVSAETPAAPAVKETAPKQSVAPAKSKAAPAKKTASPKKKPATKTVTAKSGDSLDRIAKRNGTTVKKLKRLNRLSGNNPIIQPGQKIRVK